MHATGTGSFAKRSRQIEACAAHCKEHSFCTGLLHIRGIVYHPAKASYLGCAQIVPWLSVGKLLLLAVELGPP